MTAPFNQMEILMKHAPVIPVLTVPDVAMAVPMARALVAGGLRVLEVTLRTPAALDVIKAIAGEVPEAIPGAGTVLDAAAVEAVAKAGGRFCVSPGSTTDLIRAAGDTNMQLLPGAVTATEVMNLLAQDINFMKFFPAEAAGGMPVLKSLAAPLAAARFCPTGGISPENAASYLTLPNVLCVGGTWVCPGDALENGDWKRIETLARQASGLAQ